MSEVGPVRNFETRAQCPTHKQKGAPFSSEAPFGGPRKFNFWMLVVACRGSWEAWHGVEWHGMPWHGMRALGVQKRGRGLRPDLFWCLWKSLFYIQDCHQHVKAVSRENTYSLTSHPFWQFESTTSFDLEGAYFCSRPPMMFSILL